MKVIDNMIDQLVDDKMKTIKIMRKKDLIALVRDLLTEGYDKVDDNVVVEEYTRMTGFKQV